MENAVFKYLPEKYAMSLVHNGELRIGTLFDYRKTEEYGENIGDSDEGICFEYSHDQNIKTGDDSNPLERQAIKAGPGMVMHNNYVERKRISPNVYLYCASSTHNPKILSKLNQDCPADKYDTCVLISQPKKFVDAITQTLSDIATFVDSICCIYRDRNIHYSENQLHPAIVKDPKYAYQKEVRFI